MAQCVQLLLVWEATQSRAVSLAATQRLLGALTTDALERGVIGIAGHIRVPRSARDDLEPHLKTYVPECRAEDGCRSFTLAFDALEPEMLRVFEIWDDEAALKVHVESAHETKWRATCKQLDAGEHSLTLYEITVSAPVG
jgi:quinol monooxygenase YgiN